MIFMDYEIFMKVNFYKFIIIIIHYYISIIIIIQFIYIIIQFIYIAFMFRANQEITIDYLAKLQNLKDSITFMVTEFMFSI